MATTPEEADPTETPPQTSPVEKTESEGNEPTTPDVASAGDASAENNESKGDSPAEPNAPSAEKEAKDEQGNKTPSKDESSNEKTAQGPASVLQQRPFIIRTLKHDGSDGGGVSTGSILSQSLDKLASSGRTNAGTLTLAGLRKLVPGMSRYPTLEKFCTPTGTLIDDEAISFSEYLALEEDSNESATAGSGAPSVRLYFRSTKRGELAGKGSDGEDASGIQPFDSSTTIQARDFAEVENLQKSDPRASLLTINPNISSKSQLKSAGTLHEEDWDVVLRNCGVFYGWLIDPRSRQIVRAPKQAFRLRSKVDQTSVAKIPDWHPTPTKVLPARRKAKSNGLFDSDGNIRQDTATAGGKTQVEVAVKVNTGSGAKKAEQNMGGKRKTELKREVSQAEDGENDEEGDEEGDESEDETSAKEKDPIEPVVPKSEKGIPNFRVNDDSKIEITAHEDELTVSMAKSDFSETSTEASVSGGGYGVSASASYGEASKKENTTKTTDSTTNRIMVARYMFPRADLLLWPDELVPTDELNELIQTIRTTKSIKALKKLQSEYGQLFCQRVTLGGRLLATQLFSSTEKKSLEEKKESFKQSVGASVSGSYAGVSASASMKHEEAQGQSTSDAKEERKQDESAVFEAVGGDTILANNPVEWCKSVGSHHNWRVINREGLVPLPEILSAMPGYEAIQSWFVQAIPALTNYMVLDAGHECKARFRVNAPTNSLSLPNISNSACFYLGHDPDKPVTPRLNEVKAGSVEFFWSRFDLTENIPIFNPPTYRAPALLGYDKFDVEGTPYGSSFNAGFLKTAWTIIAPFDDELVSGTRVILRANPFRDSSQPESALNGSHMVVFRNAQGEFLPAMSDSGEYQYWRLLKTDPSQRYIKPGDEVKLAWDFRDQTTGWRDFMQDVFGRRQPSAPADYDPRNPLFLKVPWPRFESSGVQTALILSPRQEELSAKTININVKEQSQTMQYCLQDLRLRIDSVGNDGRGDSEDYLLNKLRMEGVQTIYRTPCRPAPPPMQMRTNVFWFGVK